MSIKKILAYMGMLALLFLTGCGKDETKEIPAATVAPVTKNTTQEEIQKQLGDAATTETNRDSGISASNYEDSEFAGYNGQISFYYNEDGSLLYYKWFITESDKSKSKEIYSDVCKALEGSYGEGEKNNSEATGLYTTSFTNESQQITAQLQSGGSGYEISYMVTG